MSYFLEVALGAEYGDVSKTIRKWGDRASLRIKIHGNPTATDKESLKQVASELVSLTGLQIQLVDSNPNVNFHFIKISQFKKVEPNTRPGNQGFAYTYGGSEITKANILISTDPGQLSQQERSHLIREELTQSLGLLRDSNRYKDSIFYGGWTTTNQFSRRDEKMIRALYQPAIRIGQNASEVKQVLGK